MTSLASSARGKFFGPDEEYRKGKARFALKNLRIKLAKEKDPAKRAVLEEKIRKNENCLKDMMKCA